MRRAEERDRFTVAVTVILVVAFVVRVALLLVYRHIQLLNDPADYNRLAVLAQHGHFFGPSKIAPGGGPTAVRTPVYPVFLAIVYTVAGPHPFAPRVLQAFIGVGTVGLVGIVARQLFDRRVCIAAMIIAALDPALLIVGGTLLTESLFLPLELGALAAALAYRRNRDVRFAYLAGALAGVATLTRPVGLVLLPVVALLALRRPGKLRGWRTPAVVVVIAAVVIAPWEIRNQLVFHEFVPLTTIDGINLAGTYNDTSRLDPHFPAAFRVVPDKPPYSAVLHDKSLDEAQFSVALRRVAVRYMRQHPSYPLEVVAWNTLRLFELRDPGLSRIAAASIGYGKRMADAERFAWYLILLLAIVGVLTDRVRRVPLAVWLAPLLVWAITVPVLGDMRYRTPIEPFAILVAGSGAVAIVDRLRRGDARARSSADTG